MNTQHIHISDYDYPLPDERIAKYPVAERDHSKLLIYKKGAVSEDVFYALPKYLPQGALMVFNNTKVIQARLHFRKSSGALIEIFCLEPFAPRDYEQNFGSHGSCRWICMIGNAKKWKEGTLTMQLKVGSNNLELSARRVQTLTGGEVVEFAWNDKSISFSEVLEVVGELPIPPYLHRPTEERDKSTYQTVYSKIKGSVAAPTAGLHFTPRVLKALDAAGVERDEITLHVGAGTFKPVKSEEIADHTMHSEFICVTRHNLERLIAHDACAIAVGTTSVRTLESLYYIGLKLWRHPELEGDDLHVAQWEPYELASDGDEPIAPIEALKQILRYLDRHGLEALRTSTQIIIAPGYRYHIVKMMVTNFHQPHSTLLLLVSAFVHGDWRKIYHYALEHGFRFLSYGDSSLLIP